MRECKERKILEKQLYKVWEIISLYTAFIRDLQSDSSI